MTWNHDISAAPRGHQVTVTRKVRTADGYADRDFTEHHVAPLWLARADGKVVRSYWIPAMKQSAGRRAGFAEDERPVAWQHFVTPEHPFAAASQGEAAAPAPKNVSLPEVDMGWSGDGANVGGDDALTDQTSDQPYNTGEEVNASPAPPIAHKHIFLDDAGSGA